MIDAPINHTQKQRIVELQGRIRQWERRSVNAVSDALVTGCSSLDALLPLRGIRRGSLVEWIGQPEVSGAATVSLAVARQVCTPGRPVVFVDGQCPLYPVAMAALGMDLGSLVFVHADSEQGTLWACEEALRCRAVAMVWAKIDRLAPIAFRRLQLAAEEAGAIGFLVRPSSALKQPSWADVRLVVTPRVARGDSLGFRVKVAYSHGKTERSVADLAIDSVQGTLHETYDAYETHLVSGVS
jgi:protein ImuA